MKATRILPLCAVALLAVSFNLVGAADDAQPQKGQFQKGQFQKGQQTQQKGQLQQGFGRGGASLLSADALDKLKLTADQKTKYDAINSEYTDKQKGNTEKIREAFQSKDAEKIKSATETLRADGQKLRTDCLAKVEQFLTGDQKKIFEEVKAQQPGRGGFGGGAGGGTPGTVLSSGMQDRLKLTDEQKKQIESLQKEIDGKINSILNEEQRKQLDEIKKGGARPARPNTKDA
jgi:Spy/CpxP family protein refolding chaperone